MAGASAGSGGPKKSLSLRTSMGPVTLRQPREQLSMLVEAAGVMKISRGWLSGQRGEQAYHRAVKQAMLIAAEQMHLVDAEEPGQNRYSTAEIEQTKAKVRSLLDGQQRIMVASTTKRNLKRLVKKEDRQRDVLVKFSKSCCPASCRRRERSFIIDNGELLVYKGFNQNAKLKDSYKLKDATCLAESKKLVVMPKWEEGYTERIRVDCKERIDKNPLYLYSNDEMKMERWKRAFGLAKVLVAENDRRALKTSIGRATSGSLVKAWQALTTYYREIDATRATVRLMAMRLVKVDLSRGWTKFRLVHKKREDQEKRKNEQRIWAARFMSEKLAKLGTQQAKGAQDVRETLITCIQKKFRRYREDMIFDRTYPLGSQQMSRVQQAKLGKTLDFAFSSVRSDDAIRLSLHRASMAHWEKIKDKLGTGNNKPTYSEVNIPVTTTCVYVSDNLTSLSFSGNVEDADAYSALGKADWSKFINLDRISSIVLHTDPLLGGGMSKDGTKDGGVWCTIHGPRLGWDKRIGFSSEEKGKVSVKGSPDGFAVPNALVKAQKDFRWISFQVTIGPASLQLGSHTDRDGERIENRTFAVAHVMGWAYQSEIVKGDSPDYKFTCNATVPVHSKDDFVALDYCEIGVEIYEVEDEDAPVLVFVGTEMLADVWGAGDDNSGPSLAEQIKAAHSQDFQLKLGPPMAVHAGIVTHKGEVNVKIQARITESRLEQDTGVHMTALDQVCSISPELLGGGVMTSLYTSHRGAWYDPELGPGKFRLDHVANFVELSIGSLRFPSYAEPDSSHSTYRIQASLHGFSTQTVSLHRPKESWKQVLGSMFGDPFIIKFQGCRLYLPLPPGSWGKDPPELEAKRKIKIQVIQGEDLKHPEKDYREFVSSAQAVRPDQRSPLQKRKGPAEVVLYEAVLSFDYRMLVDDLKGVSLYLTKPGEDAADINVYTGMPAAMSSTAAPAEEGMLNLDFALRDRDYVKGIMGQTGERRALCVGDKATLVVEEPFLYPDTIQDFRKRFCPGQYNNKQAPGTPWQGGRGAPLRDPCLSSEYAESGLGDLVPKVHFKQSFIPTFCTEIIPHKYVLPLTEKQFIDQHLPGFYHRILDDLSANVHKDEKARAGSRSGMVGVARPLVKWLSHMNRQIPVTLLAVYGDGTWDVELSPEFMEVWSKQERRRFAMPGTLVMPSGTPARGVPRAVLKRVPYATLSAVHYSGINVYDAKFKTVEDVLLAKPPVNDFNPCEFSTSSPEEVQQQMRAKKIGRNFCIACGPLPPDASPAACQYEWSIRVRSPNEYEMHQFVAMIKRCVRMDHYQQASKMLEYQKRTTEERAPQQLARPLYGGQLDVVLIEARRLLPLQSMVNRLMNADPSALTYQSITKPTHPIRSDKPIDDNYLPKLMGTTAGESTKGTPEGSKVNTFVNFRMLNNREVVPYRGQRVQQSPVIFGTDSPSWGAQEALQTNGGWTFKTGNIDPERMPDLIVDFEVMQAHVGFSSRIGAIQLPVTQRQFLTNPNEPFKNLWLPLVSVKDGRPVANPTGEIHVMTRWLPAEKMQMMADGTQKLQMSVRMMFLKELWPRLAAPRLREPIYGIETQCLCYNPNLVQGFPEAPKDHIRRHAEELANAVPYLECLERRQLQAWDEFEQELEDEERGVRIGEIRLLWVERESFEQLDRLKDLIQRGIPSSRRERIWAELTLSSRVMERDGVMGVAGRDEVAEGTDLAKVAEAEYKRLLDRGLPQRSDAMMQLQEDSFHLAGWETSVPPLPEVFDQHLRRLKKAQNVVTALLAVEDSGLVYCESLLVLAFFLLLPQGCKEEKSPDDGSCTYHSESSVFWLLYTLICTRTNGTYREYYGTPQSHGGAAGGDGDSGYVATTPTLCATSGAMGDVTLLECCIAYHEPELWQKFNALGFMLPTVFFGAFMRLYATYMPTASVFRFWDILFAQSTDPKAQPHARAYLIDLAFGVIRARKVELLACQSAFEIRHLILGVLGSLYDTSTVVDLTMTADAKLWGGSGFSRGKIGNLWTQREDLFSAVNMTAKQQNEVLKQLVHILPLKLGSSPSKDDGSRGVTTKDLLKEVLPVLQQSIEGLHESAGGRKRFWAMFRPAPLAGRVLCQNALEKVRSAFTSSLRVNPRLPPPPKMVGPPEVAGQKAPTPGLEPLDITDLDIATVLEREFPSWASQATGLWNSFTNSRDKLQMSYNAVGTFSTTQSYGNFGAQDALLGGGEQKSWFEGIVAKFVTSYDPDYWGNAGTWPGASNAAERISLNELFISLICASRGTIGEKASALFNIYSYNDPVRKDTYHWTPVSRLARSIANAAAESAQDVIGKALAPPPPDSEDALQNALRFQVWSNFPTKNSLLGSVFVPSLSPFVGYGTEDPQFSMYNIWGYLPNSAARLQQQGSSGQDVRMLNTGGMSCIGEICMAITWTPTSIRRPEEGQLCINLKCVRFFTMFVSDYFKKNPWVTVQMCKEQDDTQGVSRKSWVNIPRWNPRGLIGSDKQHSYLTTHGAFGGHIEFERTMKEGLFRENFSHYIRDGNQGYNPETREWQWNEVWGKQHSTDNLVVMQEYVRLSQRKNIMDLQGVRLLVSSILQRCMLNVTNRQAILIADSIFNRSGSVPGIVEAVIVQGTADTSVYKSLAELKKAWNNSRTKYVDVTNQFALEHERQIALSGGRLTMFSEDLMSELNGNRVNLQNDMHIQDPFPGSAKTLWLRYIRGGDGDRLTQAIPVAANGDIDADEVQLELQEKGPQTQITKEEFISCMLSSPLMGESLRRLGHCEHVMHAKRSIPLDVTVMDPHHEEEDEQLNDVMNVQQSILLEVWDSDVVAKDFLGEAWLPPLSSFGPRMKDIALPLVKADFGEDAENGPSRPGDKDIGDDKADPTRKITGELYVSVSWKFPVYEEKSLEQDIGTFLSDLSDNQELVRYEQAIRDNFGALQVVAEQMVSSEGVLSNDFFKRCNIDKAHHKKFQTYFKEHTQGENLQSRGDVQEKMHTGMLKIRIDRARMLRSPNAHRFQNCDAHVQVWIRNDAKGAWRKKPWMRTKVVNKTRDPVWNMEQERPLLTGSFEARFREPEEGWIAEVKKALRSRSAQKQMDEERAVTAVKRFGQRGLRVKFVDEHASRAPATPSTGSKDDELKGDNHQIEVFLGDSIREFKHKLTTACAKEAAHWKRIKGESADEAVTYSDIHIGHRHLVMVFVPSPKVLKLHSQKLHDGAEYSRAYKEAWNDPSSWQPLDPARTFAQYPQFGFGRKQAQLLRVVEATEAYKTMNLRYKVFEEDLHRKGFQDTNDKERCFGWARYRHAGDEDSGEWRPAFISKSDQGTGHYQGRWVFEPGKSVAGGGSTSAEREGFANRDKADILLAPRCPKFDDQVIPEHKQYLDQAKMLRASGKSDWEIETVLNKLLDDKWQEYKESNGIEKNTDKWPRITVDMIRAYLQRQQEQDVKAAESRASTARATTLWAQGAA